MRSIMVFVDTWIDKLGSECFSFCFLAMAPKVAIDFFLALMGFCCVMILSS